MRAKDFIVESQGGLIRRAQEVAQGKKVSFTKGGTKLDLLGTKVIPEDTTAFSSLKELEENLELTLGNSKVAHFSKLNDKHRAALIVNFVDPNDTKPEKTVYSFVKFVNALKPGAFPVLWTNSEFTTETGWIMADSKIAERAQFNLKPTALFNTDKYLPAANIPNLIKPRQDLPPEVSSQVKELLTNVANGVFQPVAGAEKYMTTYEIDLGESAAPIALVTGQLVSGAYREAEDALLKPLNLTWADVNNVLFPGAGSNLLYDSYLQLTGGTSLKVSSKDKKGGAAAAVTGLVKEIEQNPERFAEITNNKEFQKILSIVKIIASNSAIDGPLMLAVKQVDDNGVETGFNILESSDVDNLRKHYGKGEKADDGSGWTKTPKMANVFASKGAKMSDLAYDIGFHALAGVAELIAKEMNKMAGVDKFFRAILERSTMIQVKASMRKIGNGAAFNNFTVIYPPVFTGGIKVVAGNNYMASRKPIGKISFKIG